MSKSLGNFFTVRDVVEKYGYEPIRYLMVSSHYRMPINYSVEIIEQCKASLERLYNCKNNLEFAIENAAVAENDGDNALIEAYDKHRQKFISAMDDDLNTADAITVMFELAKDINTNITNAPSKKLAEESLKIFMELANVLGLLYVDEKLLSMMRLKHLSHKEMKLVKTRTGQQQIRFVTSLKQDISFLKIHLKVLSGRL